MAHNQLRVNLSASAFPFATELWGRSIIVPQIDENYEKVLVSPADISKDKGIPQAFYMHNVMPTAQGYQAIGYDVVANPPAAPGPFNFDTAFPLQNSNGNRFLFVPANGTNWIYDTTQGGWIKFPFAAGTLSAINPPIVTTAFVNGQTYIFYANYGCFKYNDAAVTFDSVALSGLTVANISGICNANGYMIAYSVTAHPAVLWSNSSNPTDFVPSLITGAGSTDVQGIQGQILVCLPISGGFIVYCTKNAIAATYTNNAEVPYSFLEVPGSGGISDPEQVSWQANLGYHQVWSSYGAQQISLSGAAVNTFPELTDFMAGNLFEDFDEVSLLFSQVYLTTPLFTRMTVVENSYMILSYGQTQGQFTHAIVYDMTLARFGKVKIPHVDCFQWNEPGVIGALTYAELGFQTYAQLATLTYAQLVSPLQAPSSARTTLAFLQLDGTVKRVNFDFSEENLADQDADGVLLLGKFQYIRQRFIEHQWSDVENIKTGQNFAMYVLPTLDGKTFQPAVSTVVNRDSPNSKRLASWTSGQNISLLFTGAFNLTTVIMDFTLGGEW